MLLSQTIRLEGVILLSERVQYFSYLTISPNPFRLNRLGDRGWVPTKCNLRQHFSQFNPDRVQNPVRVFSAHKLNTDYSRVDGK